MKSYRPHKKSQLILERAWRYVQSVPYTVTLRWLFYCLLQDGTFADKTDYNSLKTILSIARKRFYEGWRPDTLADDTRVSVVRGEGFSTPQSWATALAERGACNLARWDGQDYYVEVWFEAKAMKAQFEYYTDNITLRPFGGDPSIPFKWHIAEALTRAADFHGLGMVILYFGDLDPKGISIPQSMVADVRQWCDTDFEFVRVGLNPGDGVRYNIPENPDRPGTYQWEALSDEAAKGLITSAVAQYVDYDKMREIEALETKTTAQFRQYMTSFTLE